MTDLLHAMGLVLAVFALYGPALIGIGLALRRAAGESVISSDHAIISLWIGYAVVIGLLQLWNFFLPVNIFASICIVACGWGLFLWRAREVCSLIRVKSHPVLTLVVCALVLWLANRAIGACQSVDSGVYHAQGVKWAGAFAVVPGLANLNTQLGFNSSHWLFCALFDVGLMSGRGSHGPVALLMLAALCHSAVCIARLARRDNSADASTVFDSILIVPAVHLTLSHDICDYRTDVPSVWLCIVAASRLVRLVMRPRASVGEQSAELISIAALCAAAVAVKLPTAILAAGMTLAAGWVWLSRFGSRTHRQDDHPPPRGRVVSLAALLLIMIGVPWLARGVIVSGYPFYPLPAVKTDVPWRVPLEAVEALNAWVRQYARVEDILHDRVYHGWEWVLPWAKGFARSDPFKTAYPLLISLVIGAVGLAARIKTGRLVWPSGKRFMLLPLLIAAAAWFLLAPSSRWAMTMAWIGLAYFFACVYLAVPWRDAAWRGRVIAIVSLLLILPPVVGRVVSRGQLSTRGISGLVFTFVFPPGPDQGFHPMPRFKLMRYVTDSGLELTVPEDNDRVFDAPIPSTPHPVKNLRIRRDGDLSSGFILESDRWKPEKHWPNVGSNFWDAWERKKTEK